ncbi:antibiotic biosynthesis monooxygenase [Sansalvadorimonas sp. 2012CJ34-2]|uniref:Antibiotic biosynthesis monooxygenase n=1 Tax=Parendozoicomonas callyspongiae TaxID=2942213 RepID=A0ABT0PI16_9GAMM|nr:antibiotic biosynthesis monooxygenase [Sansalvadorimonas sp. 2012CJ34-2]MCL6271023.1 antibiotic biosynthesis monooxygenase [Sansalvadorimonas sp. 2012CJ34-2]
MIKVIIDRLIAEGLEQHYDQSLRDTVSLIENTPGFLGSETLRDIENSSHRVTVSLWDNLQCWSQWASSDNRRKLHSHIDPLLDHEEQITILTH